jgi:hypothetical protein
VRNRLLPKWFSSHDELAEPTSLYDETSLLSGEELWVPYLDQITLAHHVLERKLNVVRDAMARCWLDNGKRTFALLARCLIEWSAELKAHFVQEEVAQRSLDEQLFLYPALTDAARETVSEHPLILAKLDQLIIAAQTLEPSSTSVSSLRFDFGAFCQILAGHVRGEEKLFARFCNEVHPMTDAFVETSCR